VQEISLTGLPGILEKAMKPAYQGRLHGRLDNEEKPGADSSPVRSAAEGNPSTGCAK